MSNKEYLDYSQMLASHPELNPDDMLGNNDIGRYVFLCGSRKRAEKIGSLFNNLEIKKYPLGYELFIGNINGFEGKIDVAVISTGMGCPSLDIIMHQLFAIGARRFLRIGTAGSLQANYVKTGQLVVATGAVRDEHTSMNYIGLEYPAMASTEFVNASLIAGDNLKLMEHIFPGIVHTKDSIFARELGFSHLKENHEYMENLKLAGVVASEMECSHIFVLSSIFNYRATNGFLNLSNSVMAGAILAVVGDDTFKNSDVNCIDLAVDRAIKLGFETIKVLYALEKKHLK